MRLSYIFPLTCVVIITFFAGTSTAFSSSMKIVDSHLHIWSDKKEAFEKDQIPPDNLLTCSTPEALLIEMEKAQVDGALIVQPINFKFDHTYVTNAIKKYPQKFKGMLLHDPSLSPEVAVERLEELVLAGFVGVRFNPYLWSENKLMSEDNSGGLAVYQRCAELQVPVGIMCFRGLGLHFDDIISLIEKSPNTQLVLDHLGFCALNDTGDEAFKMLLKLGKYPNVSVKVSALFRNTGDKDSFPYEMIKKERFDPLLESFGPGRLMVGSDFPFVSETEGGYSGAFKTVQSWLNDDNAKAVLSGTAERLFGKWG